MKGRRFRRLGDTCRYRTGWGAQGASSSLFWRFFEFGEFLTRLASGVLSFSSFQKSGVRLRVSPLHFPVSFLRSLFFFILRCVL
jgi:hypothetical protein